jgi:hypothetical protein
MTTKQLIVPVILLAAITVFLLGIAYNFGQPVPAYGSAPSGIQARMATSSYMTVNANGATYMGSTTQGIVQNCSSRVISTRGLPITISMENTNTDGEQMSSTTLNASGRTGIYQAASTTVAYDSGIYGCGAWYVRAIGGLDYGDAGDATTTITYSEFR